MQWSRVKTILIVLLLFVDSFLLCTLGGKAWFAYQRGQEMRAHIQAVLGEKGMMLADTMKIPGSAMMPQLYIDRSRAEEAAVAAALLGGSAERRDEGEASYFESEQGEVVWNEQGELDARLTPEGYVQPSEGQLRSAAEQILKGAGLYSSEALWDVKGNAITASVKTAGYEVFNRRLTITYEKDGLRIQGRWTFSEPYSTKSNLYASYPPSDALVLFAGFGLANRIDSMEPGLLLTNAAGNQFALSPVWRIVTDKGEFFVDPLKKSVVET